MKRNKVHSYFKQWLLFIFLLSPGQSYSSGMVPESSVLIIEEEENGGTINITNTDDFPSLLYTTVVDLDDDRAPVKLIVTQPVVRVEPKQTQQVRFILGGGHSLNGVEHYKRVVFEGIPPKTSGRNSKIGINIRQDIPVLIRPKNLPVVTDAWKFLEWTYSGSGLTVKNPSNYVVRIQKKIVIEPGSIQASIGKTYILPGQSVLINTNKNFFPESNKVMFFPVSRYGVPVSGYVSDLKKP